MLTYIKSLHKILIFSRKDFCTFKANFCFSPSKHNHAQSHRRAYGVQLQGLSTTVFLPRWFDYGTYLPTAERREQIAHRWASLPVCVCVWVHAHASVCIHTVRVAFLCMGLSPCVCMFLYEYVLCLRVCICYSVCCAEVCLSPFTFSTYLDMQTPLCEGVRCE